MTRDSPERAPGPGPDPDRPEEPTGHLRPTSPAAITGFAVVGLVGGWLIRPLFESWWGPAPVVSWPQVVLLVLVALVVGYVAWATHRSVQVRQVRLEPHRAVNRLVLGRACALVGALLAGGYLGYAVSWLGLSAELAGERILRSCLSAAAGVAICVGGLLLERACRVKKDDAGL